MQFHYRTVPGSLQIAGHYVSVSKRYIENLVIVAASTLFFCDVHLDYSCIHEMWFVDYSK